MLIFILRLTIKVYVAVKKIIRLVLLIFAGISTAEKDSLDNTCGPMNLIPSILSNDVLALADAADPFVIIF